MFGPHYPEWHPRPPIRHINDIIEKLRFEPDVILSYMAKDLLTIEGLRDCTIPKIHWAPDYVPLYYKGKRRLWIGRHEDHFIADNRIEVVLCPNLLQVDEIIQQHAIVARYFPFSVDRSIFTCYEFSRPLDVSAIMSAVPRFYKNRMDIIEAIEKMDSALAVGGYSKHKERIYYDKYVKVLCGSKIVVNATSLTRTDFRPLNPRFFEIPSCGALLLTEPADDMGILGFVAGTNCDTFESVSEMKDKIRWYLKHEEHRAAVAAEGQRLIREYHSSLSRVHYLTHIIREEFGERITQ